MFQGTVTRDQYADMSLVVYSKTDNGYTVTTGNVLPTSGINDLKVKAG